MATEITASQLRIAEKRRRFLRHFALNMSLIAVAAYGFPDFVV